MLLLVRTAHALMLRGDTDKREVLHFLECAAAAGDHDAQLSLGLLYARIEIDGQRNDFLDRPANYKKAIRWLERAASQGVAKAMYALSRIYRDARFSQRNLTCSDTYLCEAASAGYLTAQYELGILEWRRRKHGENRDVLALYWLQKAARQGCTMATAQMQKIAPRPQPAEWAIEIQRQVEQHGVEFPLALSERIALAGRFGLWLPEALLIDVVAADQGHCLLVDIQSQFARARRRLIQIDGAEDRAEIDRIVRSLGEYDFARDRPKGRYRRRLHQLKTLVPDWAAVQRAMVGVSAYA